METIVHKLNGIRNGTLLACVMLCVACVSTPERPPDRKPVFYPLPPAPSRVQFLTSFSDSKDITGRENQFLKFIVGEAEVNPIVKPYGIDVWDDSIYVCDTQLQAIVVIDLKNKEFRYFTPSGQGRLVKPINIAIDENGTKYVTDTSREAVLVFDGNDNYLRIIEKEGWKPIDIAVGTKRLYISDLNSHSVTVWDKTTEEFLYSLPRDETDASRLYSPLNIALGGDEELYVSDMGSAKVMRFSAEGTFQGSIGSYGDSIGQFARPKGIDLDDDGRLYVVDAAFQLLQIFDEEGRLLMFFGEPAGEQILYLPAKVKVSFELVPYFVQFAAPSFEVEYVILVTSQYGPHKIAVFGFGRRVE